MNESNLKIGWIYNEKWELKYVIYLSCNQIDIIKKSIISTITTTTTKISE